MTMEDEPIEQAPDEEEPSLEPKAELVAVKGGEKYVIGEHAVVGRFDPEVGPVDVDLANIAESVYISRKHAQIRHRDGVWYVEDLGSSNGTFLLYGCDFQRLEEESPIEDGQEVAFGTARFVFHSLSSPAPALEVVPEADLTAEESAAETAE